MNDELTTRLSRQLHEQVDDWQDTPLTLDGVRGRARSIRRTRRIVATAAVAAVIAIAAPVAVVAGGGLDASPDRTVPPATNSPTKAVDTANPEPEGSGLGVPYLQGRTLTMPDGTEQELPRAYDSAVVLGDRVMAVRVDTDNGQAILDELGSGGELIASFDMASPAFAPNADGTAVAYVAAAGNLVIATANGSVSVGSYGQVQPVRLFGGPECIQHPDRCLVFVDTDRTPMVVTGSGQTNELPPRAKKVEDASTAAGRVAILTSVNDLEPSSCSEVLSNSQTEGTVFETCDFTPLRFSPDGSYLSAGPDYQDGIGDGFVAIIDGDTGDELARYEPDNGFINRSVWEDPEHLLTVAYDGGEWSVVRLGADGSTETVLGPVKGGEMQPPWRLLGAS